MSFDLNNWLSIPIPSTPFPLPLEERLTPDPWNNWNQSFVNMWRMEGQMEDYSEICSTNTHTVNKTSVSQRISTQVPTIPQNNGQKETSTVLTIQHRSNTNTNLRNIDKRSDEVGEQEAIATRNIQLPPLKEATQAVGNTLILPLNGRLVNAIQTQTQNDAERFKYCTHFPLCKKLHTDNSPFCHTCLQFHKRQIVYNLKHMKGKLLPFL